MTEEDRFVFDLQGYLVIKSELSGDEVAELNRPSDKKFPYDDPEAHHL